MSSSGKKVVKPRPYVPPISPHLFRDPKARRNAWAVLQTKEQIANAALCKMWTEMNALLPISLLPIEVLCQIFALVAATDPVVTDNRCRGYPILTRQTRGWIRVSHVCRSWREAALGCPTLWTNVPLYSGDFWRDTFLARSRAAAIDVTAPRMGTKWHTTSIILSEHLHRVRNLTAYIPSQDVLDFLSSPAPLLEHLDIECFSGGPVPLIFPNLFSGDAPRLTSVFVSESSSFPAHPTLYANVSKFAISSSILDPDAFHIPSTFDFFSTLQSMSEIAYLQLDGCLPAVPGPPWPEHTLHFPHLSHLELQGPISHVSGVLDQIRLSRLCVLRVHCEMSGGQMANEHDIPPFLRALHRTGLFVGSKKPGEAFVIRALRVSSYDEDCIGVSAWLRPYCVDECSSLVDQRDPSIVLGFQWPDGHGGLPERRPLTVRGLVCQSLPLDELEVLVVDSLWSEWTAERWKALFGRCAKVKSVYSGRAEAISLFHALFPQSEPGSDGRSNEVLFPSLSRVSVFNVNFYAPATEGSAETTRDWLRRLFQARRDVGHPIAKLQAGRKNSTLDWADGLRDVVDVEWVQDRYGRDTIFTNAEALADPHDDEDWHDENWD